MFECKCIDLCVSSAIKHIVTLWQVLKMNYAVVAVFVGIWAGESTFMHACMHTRTWERAHMHTHCYFAYHLKHIL